MSELNLIKMKGRMMDLLTGKLFLLFNDFHLGTTILDAKLTTDCL
jgi:hypothetical protein